MKSFLTLAIVALMAVLFMWGMANSQQVKDLTPVENKE